jgi:hypothetical protein
LSRESFSDGGDPRAAIRLAAAAVGDDEVDADMMMMMMWLATANVQSG